MNEQIMLNLGLAWLSTHIIEWLKRASWFPLLNSGSDWLNRLASVFMALVNATGIHYVVTGSAVEGGTITITIPMLSVVVSGLLTWLGQFAMQEGLYQATLKTPERVVKTSSNVDSINAKT